MDKEISEIAKLTGRISQDPKSKLFVPLAEEYKKAGDLEMAIHVLLEGLKQNPDYVTARTSLGKLFLAKGDLTGAQKEFEEVVRHIPDNLMAHKKLGDLFVVQKLPDVALPHYKIALSLNPSDGELASLISDIENGRDVSSHILLTKPTTISEHALKQDAQVSSPDRDSALSLVAETESTDEHVTHTETSSVVQDRLPDAPADAVRTPVSSVTGIEEAEEIFIVEPLDEAIPGSGYPANGFDHAEQEASDETPPAGAELDSQSGMPERTFIQDEPSISGEILPDTDLGAEEGADMTQPPVSDDAMTGDSIDAAFGEEFIETAPETAFDSISEKTDDFTTDTLAELYIAQGFFEKAIEIYERMLADNPSSQGLQEKLAVVRAAAEAHDVQIAGNDLQPEIRDGQEVTKRGEFAEPIESTDEPSIFDEFAGTGLDDNFGTEDVRRVAAADAIEYAPKDAPDEITIQSGNLAEPDEFTPEEPFSAEDLFTESHEEQSASEQSRPLTHQEPAQFGAPFDETPVQDDALLAQQYRDFEPREYIPPQSQIKPARSTSEKVNTAANVDRTGRKETIARLESWLTHIKKEK